MRLADRLDATVRAHRSLLCVGLDPDPQLIPAHLGTGAAAVVAFNRAIVEATADLACAFKPNLGFYAAYGVPGLEALVETRRMIPSDVPVILDAKVGDISTTSEAYARGYFEAWGFDAITAHPYLGADSLEPFLRYDDRGVFVLTKTSNPGSGDLQDLAVTEAGHDDPLYLHVADRAAAWHEQFGTCGLVVGATYPRQLAAVRARHPNLPILVPGIGAQGGDLEETVRAGIDARGAGLLINASRGISYAGSGRDFAQAAHEAARVLRDRINRARGLEV